MQKLEAMPSILSEEVTVAARQYHRQARVQPADFTAEVEAVHPRHHDVGENRVERAAALAEDRQRFFSPGGPRRLIVEILKELRAERADIDVVLDNEPSAPLAVAGFGQSKWFEYRRDVALSPQADTT